MDIQLDMYQTLAIAVVVLILGQFLKHKIYFLEKFCIPAPVIGGLLFAIFTCICHSTGLIEFSFDDTLREVCMVFFFTSVGFQANLKVLKSGGKSLFIFLLLVITLIVSQNFLAVGMSHFLDLDPLIGMCTGSIPMVGGHGTAGAFGPVLEDFNISGATTICTAAATFGLIAGSLIGGPIGRRLIEKKNLLNTVVAEDDSLLIEDEKRHERHANMYAIQLISPNPTNANKNTITAIANGALKNKSPKTDSFEKLNCELTDSGLKAGKIIAVTTNDITSGKLATKPPTINWAKSFAL